MYDQAQFHETAPYKYYNNDYNNDFINLLVMTQYL